MLSVMRKHAQSWLIKVVMGIIAIVFVLYFGVSRYGQQAAKLASVNGDIVSMEQYREVYNNMLKEVQHRYRDMLNDKLLEALNLKQQALDSIINELLLIQEAHRLDFTVTPEELAASIRELPYFQKNGRFDRALYLRLLEINKMNAADFESSQTRSLLIKKVQDFITSNVVLSENEAFTEFLYERNQIKVDYLVFDPTDQLHKVKFTEQELNDFFKKNIKNYEIPTKIKIAYLLFKNSDFLDKVSISPEEIQDEYRANLDRYKEPKQVKARHILFKLEGNDPKKDAEVRKRAEEVLKRAKAGENFAELAKKYSEGPTAKNGGDLGYFSQGQMVKPFEEAAFSMKPGEISGLVKTRFGYHIIKVEDVKEAHTKTLEEARPEIEKQLKEIQVTDIVAELADQAYDQAMQGKDFKTIAKELGSKLVDTDFIEIGQPIPGLEDAPKAPETAASLEKGEFSPVIQTPKGYAILQLLDRQEPRDPELSEVKEKVEADLKLEKAKELAREEAKKFLAILKNWKELPQKAQNQKFEIKTSEPFARNKPIPEIGFAPEISQAAFKLSEKNPYVEEPVFHDGKYYLIKLKGEIPATKEEFEKEKDAYTKKLLLAKQRNAFSSWLEMVRKKATIKMYKQV
jgi:peptidyl-prolyl cis-trans isomerase D